jgi:hypothetical protein
VPAGIGYTTARGGYVPGEDDDETFFTDHLQNMTEAQDAKLMLWKVTNLAALDALDEAIVGDLAYMTTPGTGITAMWWEAHAGSAAGLDWRPVDTVIAATEANLATFVAAVAAISDTTFCVGREAYVTGTKTLWAFTSTAGAKRLLRGGRMLRQRASANLASSSSFAAIALSTSVADDGDFTYASGVFTCVTAGTYKVTLTVMFAGIAAGSRGIALEYSVGPLARIAQYLSTTANPITMSVTWVITMSAAETLTTQAYQNSASSIGVTAEIDLERVA